MKQFGKNTLSKRIDGIMQPQSTQPTVLTSKEKLEKRLIETETDKTKPATVEDMRMAQTEASKALDKARNELEVAKDIHAKLKEDRAQLQRDIAQAIEENSFDRTLVGRATNALSSFTGSDLKGFFGGIAKKPAPSTESAADSPETSGV